MSMDRRDLSSVDRQRALQIIRELQDPALPDEGSGDLVAQLERLLFCPHVYEYLFFQDEELTAEEVIEKALEYKPFAL
jgi:hypothetical protein